MLIEEVKRRDLKYGLYFEEIAAVSPAVGTACPTSSP
jgi:hypothetical protein